MRTGVCSGFMVIIGMFLWLLPVRADVITLAADEYPPYNAVPDSPAPGYVVEIAQRVFTKAGHTLAYVVVPYTRAIEEARRGTYSGIIASFYSDAPDFVFPSNEIGKCSFCFFAPAGTTWEYTGIASLKGKKLGTISGYTYTTELDAYLEADPDVDATFGDDALEKNIRKMIGGRIDLVIEDKYVFLAAANRLNIAPGGYRNAGALSADQSIYIAFTPADPRSKEYARILSEGVDALRASGELKEILAKYGLSDWK